MSDKAIKTMYAIHPGNVRARDGDVHYITAEQLIRLYGVSPRMCVVARDGWDRAYHPDFLEQFVHLYPRDDGDYTVATDLRQQDKLTSESSTAKPQASKKRSL